MSQLAIVGPLLLTIGGGVLYHLAAKSVPRTLDAALVLVVAYATALGASIAAYVLLPAAPASSASARPWHPAVLLLGLGAVLIELGYVLTYRASWPVSTASVVTNGMVAALLIPLGIGFFGERLSAANAIGLLLCLAGLSLLRR
ncbi:MAG: hypothetical protein ABR606_04835 [Vicinamibacterales bacterium]